MHDKYGRLARVCSLNPCDLKYSYDDTSKTCSTAACCLGLWIMPHFSFEWIWSKTVSYNIVEISIGLYLPPFGDSY